MKIVRKQLHGHYNARTVAEGPIIPPVITYGMADDKYQPMASVCHNAQENGRPVAYFVSFTLPELHQLIAALEQSTHA